MPFDVYRGFGFPGAEELGNMFQFKHHFNDAFGAARSVAGWRELNPRLQTFEQWLGAKPLLDFVRNDRDREMSQLTGNILR